jgi:hypothetical protein
MGRAKHVVERQRDKTCEPGFAGLVAHTLHLAIAQERVSPYRHPHPSNLPLGSAPFCW